MFSFAQIFHRTSAAAMYPDAGSVLELHGLGTAHHVGRAQTMQLTRGDEERVHGAHRNSAQTVHLSSTTGE